MNHVLSEIVTFTKYARFQPLLGRRETYSEIITRYLQMMEKKYPELSEEIWRNGNELLQQRVLPSMRAMQFSGAAMERNEMRGYNCCFCPVDDYRAFPEIMVLLLGGTGVGFSVQKHHVDKLPAITKPKKERRYLINDSLEGWGDAVKALVKSYLGYTEYKPRFDYSDIRPKGSPLKTSGGKAPGPDPLRVCLANLESVLNAKQDGDKLEPIEVHDMICHIADAVRAGGIRRAALISLFSHDDIKMITCKSGEWWVNNPQRGRSNNSAVLERGKITKEEFLQLWKRIEESGSGEPGLYWTNDLEYGSNPCCEISLRPFQFCNLTEINAGDITTQEQLNHRAKVAAFFGTLQAGFTDFHYLRPIWKRNTEQDALIGVGITGICNGGILPLNLLEASAIVKEENARVAAIIGINAAARTCTVKPAGTTSSLLGVSSGIHAWHSKYYIRNMQCKVGDEIYGYFTKHHPKLIKVMDYDPSSAVIGIPMRAPDTAILREEETALQMLERVKRFNIEWVREGHRSGPNTNNVSATVSIRDGEWEQVGEWMWDNQHTYNGLSVLPFDGGSYRDAPFMDCTEEQYWERVALLEENPVDLTRIEEHEDNTDLQSEAACAGGNCEII